MKAEIRLLGAALVVLVVATAGCGGGGKESFRIGVLTDCLGIYRSLEDAELSGAQLPLLVRGARLKGPRPDDGLTAASVAGKHVELVRACTETGEFSTMFEQVRRLVEREHVDAVVGGSFGVDSIGLRQVAAVYPDVVFVALPTGPREATLRERPANLYRFAADSGQEVAGLGTYAYRDLGWRRAAVLATDWDAGWDSTAAFVAEFCALGGTVTTQERIALVDPSGADAQRVPTDVDGVAVFTTPFFGTQGRLLRRLAMRMGDPARRVVLGPGVLGEEAALRTAGPALEGVVGAARYPQPGTSRQMDGYLAAYRAEFPGLPAELARNEFVVGLRNAVEGLLQAFVRADGELGIEGRRLRLELGRLDTKLLGQPVRLDRNGQAVVTASLVRLDQPDTTGVPRMHVVRSIPRVDQSIGGLLAPGYRPGSRDVPCRKARAPSWAR